MTEESVMTSGGVQTLAGERGDEPRPELAMLHEALRLLNAVIVADGDKSGAVRAAAGFVKKGIKRRTFRRTLC